MCDLTLKANLYHLIMRIPALQWDEWLSNKKWLFLQPKFVSTISKIGVRKISSFCTWVANAFLNVCRSQKNMKTLQLSLWLYMVIFYNFPGELAYISHVTKFMSKIEPKRTLKEYQFCTKVPLLATLKLAISLLRPSLDDDDSYQKSVFENQYFAKTKGKILNISKLYK